MSSIEEAVRRRAYELWEQAGQPEGRSEEFWFAAIAELEGKPPTFEERVEALGPPIVEPPEFAVRHGIPVGMPGERSSSKASTTKGSRTCSCRVRRATPATEAGPGGGRGCRTEHGFARRNPQSPLTRPAL